MGLGGHHAPGTSGNDVRHHGVPTRGAQIISRPLHVRPVRLHNLLLSRRHVRKGAGPCSRGDGVDERLCKHKLCVCRRSATPATAKTSEPSQPESSQRKASMFSRISFALAECTAVPCSLIRLSRSAMHRRRSAMSDTSAAKSPYHNN